jgi:two-component system sensor histidine kinase GlrK
VELTLFIVGLLTAACVFVFASARIRALQRRNDQLSRRMSEVDQMKKDFISHVSHELKAPLASMQETTQLLLERIPGPLTEKQERLLDLNLQCGKRLATMLGNILDLSRLEAGIVDYEMQCHDISGLVRSVVAELELQARHEGTAILAAIQTEPIWVDCDPRRMVQVVTNLVQNALRFSSRNGVVNVHVETSLTLPQQIPPSSRYLIERARERDGFAKIAISDSGPGIEDVHKEKIFEKFHQVKKGKKTLGQSLGLGLAISRSVVEAHYGTIWVEDNPNGGSIFIVLLPRAAGKLESAKSFKQAS